MKKFLALLCMITCIFGLTACGKEVELPAELKAKVDSSSQYVYNLTTQEYEDGFVDELKAYDNFEWEQIEASWRQQLQLKADGKAIIKGIESYAKAKAEIGTILSVTGTTYKEEEDAVISYMSIDGESHDAQLEIIFDKDLKVTSITTNVNYTLGEKMGKATLNTLLGMGTVFVVLIIIMSIISCFRYISKIEEAMANKKKGKAKADTNTAVDNTIAQIVEKEAVEAATTDDLELVAVIAAAIAASEGKASVEGFVVRSIHKRR